MEDHVNQMYGLIHYYKVNTTALDWMFVSPSKFIGWNPHPQYDGIWSWGPWEVIGPWG